MKPSEIKDDDDPWLRQFLAGQRAKEQRARSLVWGCLPFVVALLILFAISVARAADLPCPPKSYFCWQANMAFNKYGVSRVVAKAKACGWTKEEIAEALKCRE